ncbi:MAG: hypothetical protein ACWGQW_09040 [bacterium]
MARIPYDEEIDDGIIPGDDGEEMAWGKDGRYGCGGKYYRRGCSCEDCTDRGDAECHARQDREMLERFEREEKERGDK